MQTPLVMTVLGRDRTGLVESLASLVAEHGGNWLESRMCRLGGEFAGILRVHVPTDRLPGLTKAFEKLQERGLVVTMRSDQDQPPALGQHLMSLDLVGHDRPGIVRQLTAALASRGVNVEELSTECVSAPMSGESLFKATARLLVPEKCDPQKLRADLEKVAADLMVDLRLTNVS
jgi:glycine cleavage system regulatory protein